MRAEDTARRYLGERETMMLLMLMLMLIWRGPRVIFTLTDGGMKARKGGGQPMHGRPLPY